MKLIHPDFYTEISFEHMQTQRLVIENPKDFSHYLRLLKKQAAGDEGGWILSEKSKILNMSKSCKIITDPFEIHLNEKKILNALYEKIEKNFFDMENVLIWNEFVSNVSRMLSVLIGDMDYQLMFREEFEIKDFMKWMNIKFDYENQNLCEYVIDYMKLNHEVLKIELFIFVNIGDYLTADELEFIQKQAEYEKYYVLFWDSHDDTHEEESKIIHIDEEGCVIF